MLITVTDGSKSARIDLPPDCPVENLVAMALADLQKTDDADVTLVRLLNFVDVDVVGLDRSRTLAQCGITDGDVLRYSYEPLAAAAAAAAASPSSSSSSSPPTASTSSAAPLGEPTAIDHNERKRLAALLGQMRKEWKKKPKVDRQFSSEEKEDDHKCAELFEKMRDPNMKRQVFESCRRLHDQFVNHPSDYDGFKREYLTFTAHLRQKQKTLDDPNSAEGEALRLEQLRLEECDRVYRYALEKMPETFSPVQLLYIKMAVNGCPALAVVDSAAQVSLMSLPFAKRSGLERLIDTRDQSRISGIGGPDKMEGIIYACDFTIADAQFDTRVSVWKGSDDVLIGLDFMRRHRCSIDLANNRLSFTETTFAEFLSDEEVLEYKKDRNDHVHHSFKVDAEKLARLIDMGFNATVAEKALTDFANDETDVIRYLYSIQAREAKTKKLAVKTAEESTSMEH